MSPRAVALACLLVASSAAAGACRSQTDREPPDRAHASVQDGAVASLAAFEAERRATTDFARRPALDVALGPDPYVVVRAPGDRGWLGLLRNANAVVLLDEGLHEIDRAPAPRTTSALAVSGDDVLVGGESDGTVQVLHVVAGRLDHVATRDLRAGDETRGIRALAVHPSGTVYAVDEAHDVLIVAPGTAASRGRSAARPLLVVPVADGPVRVVATARHVVVASVVGHAVTAIPVDAAGLPAGDPIVIRRDGPPWSIAAAELHEDLVIATGGVEDHPLDRTGGSFAYVDPFVYLDRISDGRVEHLHAIDVGERGVLTPKALAWSPDGARLRVTGYGSARGLDLHFRQRDGRIYPSEAPVVEGFDLPPGTASVALGADGELVAANPLLDAFVRVGAGPDDITVVHVAGAGPRTDASRLGEALFFTGLLAPWQSSEGPLSRFTCETCHFEGVVDGRTHATGRGDVRATTKPLVGLFGNAPHFTRALDRDLAHMVHSEFRVASARSGHEPWFDLEEAANALGGGHDWIGDLVLDRHALDASPAGLRRAFMTFLMDFSPPPNPAVFDRATFDPLEAEGADVFARTCVSCHAARLVADDAATEVPRADWADHVFGTDGRTPGAIVWARDGYEMTGIEPYVHERGARPTSLRRLARKRPYFTNGTARTLDAVLEAVRIAEDGTFRHAVPPDDAKTRRLTDRERQALLAFLRLL